MDTLQLKAKMTLQWGHYDTILGTYCHVPEQGSKRTMTRGAEKR